MTQYDFSPHDSDGRVLADIRELLYLRLRHEIPDLPRFRAFEQERMKERKAHVRALRTPTPGGESP